jgi:hypothetical protein
MKLNWLEILVGIALASMMFAVTFMIIIHTLK